MVDEAKYRLTVNKQEYLISSSPELTKYLEEARKHEYADLALYQKSSERPTKSAKIFHRSLGLAPPTDKAYISALINTKESLAFMSFVDEEGNETFYSINPNHEGPGDKKISFLSAHGERDENLASECVATEQAWRAFTYFFETGKRPEWIHWVKVEE